MWTHIPKTYYPSTQELEDSTSHLDWLFPILEQSVTWRETSHPAAYWSKRCKQVSWMMHLFGQIPQPSMANLGVEKWIGSLGDSPVSHGQSLEKEKEQKTKDGFGMTSNKLLAKYNQKESSWKTCQVSLLDTESTPYLERFPNWGMTQDGVMSKLPMSVLPTVGHESSSWRTTAASDGEGGIKKIIKGSNSQYKLRDHSVHVVNTWGTPKARDWKDTLNTVPPSVAKGTHGASLGQSVAKWMTPNTLDGIEPRSKEAMKRQFQTTRKGRTQPANLREQVIPELHPSNLESSHQVQNQKNGITSGKSDQVLSQQSKNLRLNPRFGEWLMGWMVGLTELTDFESWETESYHYKQLMHLNYLWIKYNA